MTYQIDLNADLGEGGEHDEALLALVSSANISCGAHAGSHSCISRAIAGARAQRVHIGAHPAYPDREHFGRRLIPMTDKALTDSLHGQLETLATLVANAGATLRHVKPHGALYNAAARDRRLADLVAAVIREFDPQLQLIALAGSELQKAGESAGLHTLAEAFADRAYRGNGNLLPRGFPGAVLEDPAQVIRQSLLLITRQCVYTVDGQRMSVRADTLCLHGDGPRALVLARALRKALAQANITVGRD